MNRHFSDNRKIAPVGTRPDGTPDDDNRIEIGPTPLAFREWAEAGIPIPNLAAMRQFRHTRLVEQINKRDLAGVLVFDPLNIRYATDSTSMQLWNTHNPFRACLVCADGHMVLFDYKNSLFLADFNPLVKETRSGASMFYFSSGDQGDELASEFMGQVKDILDEHVPGNKHLAIDKIMPRGLRAFEAAAIMEAETKPGMTEDDVWAHMHAENIRRGGEWIETRLLASGPRTNPWFQECGPRIIQDNEIYAKAEVLLRRPRGRPLR